MRPQVEPAGWREGWLAGGRKRLLAPCLPGVGALFFWIPQSVLTAADAATDGERGREPVPVGPPSRTWACARPPPAPARRVWRSHSVLTARWVRQQEELRGALGPTAQPFRDTAAWYYPARGFWIVCGLVGLGAPGQHPPQVSSLRHWCLEDLRTPRAHW